MFALAEGVAAIALVAVMTAAARAARRCGQARAGLAAAAFGIAVAAVSWAELALGIWLISGLVPDRRTATAGAISHAITRMDGAKMFLLGAMALAISQLARRSPILPRWLAPLGALLAAALVTSGLGLPASHPGPCLSGVRVRGPIADIRLCYRNSPAQPRRRRYQPRPPRYGSGRWPSFAGAAHQADRDHPGIEGFEYFRQPARIATG